MDCLLENQVVELGGFHRYKIVYSGDFGEHKNSVSH
jgi:hypothetical protein